MSVTESGSPRSSAVLSPSTLFEEEQHHHQGYYYGEPASGEEEHELPHTPTADRSPTMSTRTVAMIKYHALAHRFNIEPRIQAAGFEIVKERQMEFDTETDPDTLHELFGEDASCLSEGPVWVYVLERRRAVQVWNTLMGDRDPDIARKESPNSLRALYGISREQNGLMGSSDEETAEIQIASLFVSSPPFPAVDLPDDASLYYHRRGSMHSSTSPKSGSQKFNANGKPLFRARRIPRTNDVPDIAPRTTRAAALRAGAVIQDKSPVAPRSPLSEARIKQTFANVPGHKRSEVIQVASTAAPVIAPRMTKAASLRLGQKPSDQPRRRTLTAEEAKATFDGVPGHKRRESIAVASTKAPTMAPRSNKSAALRVTKDQTPPTSYMFKGPPKAPGPVVRSVSQDSSASPNRRADPPPRPASQASQPSSRISSRPASVIGSRPSTTSTPAKPTPAARRPSTSNGIPTTSTLNGLNHSAEGDITPPSSPPATTKHARRNSISTSLPPSIAPRTNRSAALRAAKQEAEAAAAAKKNTTTRVRAPPSSFRSPQVAT